MGGKGGTPHLSCESYDQLHFSANRRGPNNNPNP